MQSWQVTLLTILTLSLLLPARGLSNEGSSSLQLASTAIHEPRRSNIFLPRKLPSVTTKIQFTNVKGPMLSKFFNLGQNLDTRSRDEGSLGSSTATDGLPPSHLPHSDPLSSSQPSGLPKQLIPHVRPSQSSSPSPRSVNSEPITFEPSQNWPANLAPPGNWPITQVEDHLNKPVFASSFFQSLIGSNTDAKQNDLPLLKLSNTELNDIDVLDSSLIDPENFRVPNSRVPTFQLPVGGKCFLPYSFLGGDGVCIAANDCPSTLTLMAQFEYTHIRSYLLDSICRLDGSLAACDAMVLSVAACGAMVLSVAACGAVVLSEAACGAVVLSVAACGAMVLSEAVEGEFPWLASIGSVSTTSPDVFSSICSGTLITRRHVLTAAHCFRNFETSLPGIVRLAEGDLFADDATSVHQDYIIVSRHAPLFYYYTTINDVMILTLDRDVTFNDYIQPACLPLSNPSLPAPGDTVTAVGYGNIQENGSLEIPARYPYRIDLPVLDNKFCQDAYYGRPPLYVVDDRVFCEGGQANRSTCKGDSGGPLHYWDESQQRYLVVGVVNAGIGCGTENNPSIDLRVGAFLPWIKAVIGS
ncbi:CLIP domain-containing serine protease B15-like [Hyalella azteca]|uniref:CLIP domain-containing serine protease B15-like n=1 Tax=Hyalella azteca TaxID=294128 RepID=A0A8B7N7R3_HYAAZ|nr:CLIP domain-containing serine protease B15-like [Hyalella azteca]